MIRAKNLCEPLAVAIFPALSRIAYGIWPSILSGACEILLKLRTLSVPTMSNVHVPADRVFCRLLKSQNLRYASAYFVQTHS